jgi:CDP-ribitol ribitolphosphotransferase
MDVEFDEQVAGPCDFRLVSQEETIQLLSAPGQSNTEYTLRLNVTVAGGRHVIPDGRWLVVPYFGGEAQDPAVFDPANAAKLNDWTKIFPYAGGRSSFIVRFDLTEDVDNPTFLIRAKDFANEPSWGETKGKFLKKFKRWGVNHGVIPFAFQAIYRVFRIAQKFTRHPQKRILLAAQHRMVIRDNLLMLRNKMYERGMDKEFDIRELTAWEFQSLPNSIKNWLHNTWEFAQADFIFVDDWSNFLGYTRTDEQQKVIQVWHAGFGFKAVGLSRFGMHGSPRPDNPHRKYSYALVGSEGLRDQYAEMFGMEKANVLPTGVIRIDELLDPGKIAHVKEEFAAKYPNLTGKRLILFAPTFRGATAGAAHYPFEWLDFQKFYDWCGDDTRILFKVHPYVTNRLTDYKTGTYHSFIPKEFSDRLVDMSDYLVTNDLLHVVDILITDYSSICYEFSYLDKPMLFFAPDEEGYSVSRGFYGYREYVPGKIVATSDELLAALESEDYETWRRDKYREQFCGPADTHNADRAIDTVIYRKPLVLPQAR